ncbi:MAG: aspartyl-phosphate phosphatase Spo0E family protein [Bacillota bacterium]
MTSENKKLKKEINKLKKKLVEVEEGKNSFKNDDILKISQKLDKLIYEYMK